jgi:hypothetical protein
MAPRSDSFRLAKWGIELGFLRTKVGKEFELVERMLEAGGAKTAFFGTYGYFDLLAIRCLSDLAAPSLVPLDRDVIESAPFRFFGIDDARSPQDFLDEINGWHAGIAVFAKINPIHFQKSPVQFRFEAASFLRAKLPGAHVFFGLGFSELLALVGGDDLPELLSRVTGLRNPTVESSDGAPGNEPLLVRTTTYPLVSYANVHLSEQYGKLKGKVHPIVTISCDPRVETRIVASLPPNMYSRNSFGESDLVLYWKSSQEGIAFSEFAEYLTKIRKETLSDGLVAKTTTYLETQRVTPTSAPTSEIRQGDSGYLLDKELFDVLNQIKPDALKASVADLVLRLSACLGDQNLEADYRDMARTFEFIETNAIAAAGNDELEAKIAGLALTDAADLARSAINQRYAGLETHPETLAHSQSPLLCDIRTIVLASSCLPGFLLENLDANKRLPEIWAGYVLFGHFATPQLFPQNILAIPSTSIYRPIEQWWRITHEVAHAVFTLLTERRPLLAKHLERMGEIYGDDMAEIAVGEFFAHWFDWKYVFQGDVRFLLRHTWRVWLPLPIVLQRKAQYLLRAFTLLLYDRINRLVGEWKRSYDDGLVVLIRESWDEYRQILEDIPDMKEYLSDVTEDTINKIILDARGAIPTLFFFERVFEAYFKVEGLSERLNPPYPTIAEHVQRIQLGGVVTDPIPNPCKLQIELMKLDNPTLQAEIAYIMTLENFYVTNISPGLRM